MPARRQINRTAAHTGIGSPGNRKTVQAERICFFYRGICSLPLPAPDAVFQILMLAGFGEAFNIIISAVAFAVTMKMSKVSGGGANQP